VALGVSKGDPAATKLKSDAQEQINLELTAREQQQKYETAMKEGQAAFDRKDYTNTVLRAEVALGIKKGDPAATKLKSDAQERINLAQQKEDLKQARAHFDQGDYAASLKLCDSRRGVAAFDSLAESNRTEQIAFNDANARFTTGDYSFIEQLKIQSYRGKQPFADLLLKTVQENGILEELKALQRATNRSAVKAKLAAVAFQNKPPFAALAAWAETPPTPGDIAPKQSLEKLDSDFEVMLVWFNILNPAKAQSSEAQKKSPIPGRIGPEEGDSYAAMAQDLESRFKQGGWLTPPREKNLKKLKDAIRYHP
jgi:uncharacterized protein YjbK